MTACFILTDDQRTDALAHSLLAPDIAVAARDPRLDHGDLWPEEQHAVARAVKSRRLEYAAGRAAARQAMAVIRAKPEAIPSGQDRAPIWPRGLTGSISHCSTACLAAVACTENVASIGIDVEPETPLDGDMLETVCTDAEQAWLARQHPRQAPLLAKLIFSAKESAYKCQFPLTRQLFDFQTLDVEIDHEAATFAAVFRRTIAPFARGHRLNGRFAVSGGLIVTTVVLRPADLDRMIGGKSR